MAERVFIIIDGSNFYHRLKELELKNLLTFNYEKFSRFLLGKRKLVKAKYYIGAIRAKEKEEKSFALWKNQRILLGNIQRQGWEIGLGHMLKTDKYHEKRVDVLMAMDLLVGAYEDLYDTAIMVTSDTDLIPAVKKVRSKGKKVEYVGFSPKPSFGLIANSDIRRLLTKEDLLSFLKIRN